MRVPSTATGAAVLKHCKMEALYCRECEGRSQNIENIDGESAAPEIENARSTRRNDLEEERGEAETTKD